MIRELAAFERLDALCVSTPEHVAKALFGRPPSAEALIVHPDADSEELAGFALFFQTYSTFLGRPGLWLEDIFVRPRYRGAGLGRRLLATLAGIARERGCGRFEWSVLAWNADAIGFYEALGAKVLPDWRIARVTGEALERLGESADPSLPRS